MGVWGYILDISELLWTQVSKDSSSIKVIDFGLAELFEPDQKAQHIFLRGSIPLVEITDPKLTGYILLHTLYFRHIS